MILTDEPCPGDQRIRIPDIFGAYGATLPVNNFGIWLEHPLEERYGLVCNYLHLNTMDFTKPFCLSKRLSFSSSLFSAFTSSSLR